MRDEKVPDVNTATKERPGKAAAAETPPPDVRGATGLGTQLSSVAGPTLQVGSALQP